jgi:hypothetical protein
MSNCNADTALLGWLLKNPKRRAMHQLAIHDAINTSGVKTDDSLGTSEVLPVEARHLITLQLLERGFQLSCSICSAKLWYRAEDVGQAFTCQRCYENQRLISNPHWLYKLPEVIFQFFEHDAEVPLLALSALHRRSTQYFQFVLDSELFRKLGDKNGQNIDFACLSDGKLFIGEAKSINEIGSQQIRFYQHIGSRVPIDGIVFATTATEWNASTLERIDGLKADFLGEVLSITRSELLTA